MDSGKQRIEQVTSLSVPDGRFTKYEEAQLEKLRHIYTTSLPPQDLGLDVRRLEFARWLVEHHIIGEAV